MNIEAPLVPSQSFDGTIAFGENAITQRDALCAEADKCPPVTDDDSLATSVAYLKDIAAILKSTEESRKKEKRPHIDFNKLVDDFAFKFIAPLERVKLKLTGAVNHWQRKQLEEQQERERLAREEQRKAEQAAAKAEEDARKAQVEIDNAKTAKARAEAVEKLMDAQLAAESAALQSQNAEAQLATPTNTPRGLVTKTRYDFEICSPAVARKTNDEWIAWKKDDEAWKFDRAGFLKALNADDPAPDITAMLPADGEQTITLPAKGLRIFSSTTTHVRA